MKNFLKYFLFTLLILFSSCNQNQNNDLLAKNIDSPEKFDFEVTTHDAEFWAKKIVEKIK